MRGKKYLEILRRSVHVWPRDRKQPLSGQIPQAAVHQELALAVWRASQQGQQPGTLWKITTSKQRHVHKQTTNKVKTHTDVVYKGLFVPMTTERLRLCGSALNSGLLQSKPIKTATQPNFRSRPNSWETLLQRLVQKTSAQDFAASHLISTDRLVRGEVKCELDPNMS